MTRFFVLAALLSLICPPCVPAFEIEPFNTYNQSPVIRIFGLPGAGSPRVVKAGKTELEFSAVLASNYILDENHRESLLIDGETHSFALGVRRGLGQDTEAGIDIPYVSQTGGFLDGVIDTWHHTFGFREGGRNLAPKNRLLYRYVRDGGERLKLDSCSGGIGDVRLQGARQLYRGGNGSAALRASLKLPTGDSGSLIGSGSTDLAVWVTADRPFDSRYGRWSIYGAGGGMAMKGGSVLAEQQRNTAVFGTLGGGWKPGERLVLKIQADAHTPFYRDSELKELESPGIQLVLGGTVALTRETTLDIAVSEDILVKSSPDVVFNFILKTRF
ncbi:MAG: DUF3187 family protein [Syntrophales bacterium]|nr:DUF3187 family protein [Syntrophales bacterium]MDD5232602.1 DUF3187 family protein [Syntrophales bacterium]